MKKLLTILIVVFLAAFLIFLFVGNGDEGTQEEPSVEIPRQEERPVYQDQPHHGLATLHCAMEVNGARFRSVGSGVPLYVKCIVTNPLPDQQLKIREFHGLTPTFAPESGAPTSPGMALVTPAAESAPPGGTAVITWVLDGTLPPDTYDISLVTPPGFADRPGLDRVRVKPARLEITDQAATADEVGWYRLQIMAARGENQEIIELVRTGLESDPENLALRRELVDALERDGDFSTARDELIELGMLAQGKQPHLPAWIITRDRLLQQKIAGQ